MVSFSVLIITHGREELLSKCLDSLRPPISNWQLILVANGIPLSEEILQKARSLTSEVDILNLETKLTPGMSRNAGVELVRHEWVYLIDDDAYILPQFFETAFPVLGQERVDVLGGPDVPARGMNNFSQALAITLASPFCTGKTFGRHQPKGKKLIPATEEILTSCNLWIRTHFLKESKFPEDYLRTEETALLIDLQKLGAHMYYHPGMKVAHHRRKNLKTLLSPTFYAGFYRSKVIQEKSVKGAELFWLPSFFVLLHILIFFSPSVFWSLARMYGAIIVMMSLNLTAKRQRMGLFLHVAVLHYVIVFLYGLGFLANRMGYRGRR